MSHFTKVSAEIRDMEALQNALRSMNLSLTHNDRCRYYYGAEIKENVVRLPGKYDMALEENANGSYSINADFFEGDVARTIGPGGSVLLRQYEIEKMRIEAKKMDCKVVGSSDSKLKIVDPKDPSGGKLEVTIEDNGQITFKAKGFKGKSCMKFKKIEEAFGAVTKTKLTSEFYEEETQQRERQRVNGY